MAQDIQAKAKGQHVEREKTNLMTAIGYSFGEVGSQFSWYMINTYLTIFYTDVVGLSATAISAIMLIARIWDAVNDPMMGVIADKTNTRWGKLRPYLMFAPPFLAIFNLLTFTVFPVTGMAKIIVCLLCYIGAGMAYTVICITYGGFVNMIARDSQVRMDYTTARGLGGSAVKMLLSAVAMPMILYFSKSEMPNANGYFMTTVVFSLLLIPCFWFCAWRCKELPPLEEHHHSQVKRSIVQNLLLLAKNKNLMITVWNVFLGAIAIMTRMSMLAFYMIYVVGDPRMIAPVFSIMTIMEIVGVAILPVVTRVFGKRNWLLMTNAVAIAGFLIMFAYPQGSMTFLLVVSAIIGLTNSGANISAGMLSDCIEYGDWKYGIREVGLTYAYMSFGVKLATAVGGSVSVLALGAIGYVPNQDQTEAVKQGINMIVNMMPAIALVLSALPLFWYDLNKKMMDKIAQDLHDRRNAQNK